MNRIEKFLNTQLPSDFFWLNEPPNVGLGAGLEIATAPETDFWQRTHYGFRRDDGHCLLTSISEDFCLTTHVMFRPQEKYDQCGLFVRLDEENWIKVSTEYEDDSHSRLGSVVTNLGYSDWATQDIASAETEMWYRVSKNGADFLLESSFDGEKWTQLRIAHLHQPFTRLDIGVYACSPIGRNFWCKFKFLQISENNWSYTPHP